LKTLQHLRPLGLQLVDQRPRQGKRDPEVAFVAPKKIEEQLVSRQIAFVRNLPKDFTILSFVFIIMVLIDVKNGVAPETSRLMDLKKQTNIGHIPRTP
jgi:hypothetical protein